MIECSLMMEFMKSISAYCLSWKAPESKSFRDAETVLRHSSLFSVYAGKELKEPFRHTSIVLFFDGEERFVISRRIPDKTSLLNAVFGAEAVTYIEDVKTISRTRQCIGPIWQSRCKVESAKMIKKLLYDPEDRYNLWDKNCRDHVASTIMSAMEGNLWKGVSQKTFLDFVENVRNEDRVRVLGIITIGCALFSFMALYFFVYVIALPKTSYMLRTMEPLVSSVLMCIGHESIFFSIASQVMSQVKGFL